MSHTDRPFVIEHRHILESPGHFTPDARLVVTPALRTSGLLASLCDPQARTLLALLTFLSPNGEVQATEPQVGEALGVPEAEAKNLLQQLVHTIWQEQPLVHYLTRDTALPVYSLSPELISNEQSPEPEAEVPVVRGAGRAAVIAYSRAHYGTPRAEAEAIVAAQLGEDPDANVDTPTGEAWRRLLALGVPKEQVKELIESYPVEAILQQLDWLPERGARNPARFIVAAVTRNYDPPMTVGMSGNAAVPEISEEEFVDVVLPAAVAGQSLSIPQVPEGGADA